MRVISQNGMIDVPYEMAALRCTETMIRMNMVGDEGKGSVMAEYSTPEKAQKAMDMLHGKWLLYMEVNGGPCATTNHYVQPNLWVLPRMFRFPEDNKIEVVE